jgi:hypothetical protein
MHQIYTNNTPAYTTSVHMDPDLAAVIAAWPTLATTVRTTVLRLIVTGEVR